MIKPIIDTHESRRSFMIKSTAAVLALSLPLINETPAVYGELIMTQPKTALVLWYSQTGNTERCGRLIAKTLEKNGIAAHASEYRNIDPADISRYDMIVAGSPVYYYEVPSNFRQWLKTIPLTTGKPVAAYVTFGGEGGNQFNTAVTLLDSLTQRGGIPLNLGLFGNMSTFAITWSSGNVKRVLNYSHLPDEHSYQRIRNFAQSLFDMVRAGQTGTFHKKTDFREWIKGGPSIWGTKLMINRHTIDADRCVECGLCTRTCPACAIDLSSKTVDTKACIACLACVNNCPEQAVDMEFMHKKIYGYKDFLRQNNIVIQEPTA